MPAGAYTHVDEDRDELELVLIGTGSEVTLCVGAREVLTAEGISTRVVSMPSWDLFEQRPGDERHRVLPPDIPTLAVEAGSRFGWERYADDVVGIDRFGASAPLETLMKEMGFTVKHVVERAHALLGR